MALLAVLALWLSECSRSYCCCIGCASAEFAKHAKCYSHFLSIFIHTLVLLSKEIVVIMILTRGENGKYCVNCMLSCCFIIFR